MNNVAFYLSRIYYSLNNLPFPGYTGESAEYWAARIYYAVIGQTVTTYADGRDASFWLEKWYREIIEQPTLLPQGGIDSAQKIWGFYAFGQIDTLYDGRSSEFWASKLADLAPSLNLPPVINNQGFNANEWAVIGSSVGTPVATDPEGGALTWAIVSGNGDGKFAINSSTGLITIAGQLNYATTASYALGVQVTDIHSVSAQATITITVISYAISRVLTLNPIQYIKGNETSGTTANDSSSVTTSDGTYINVTLDDDIFLNGDPVGDWNGTDAYLNLMKLGTTMAVIFGYQEGSVHFWFKPDVGFWSGTDTKYLLQMRTDNNNRIIIFKQNTADTLRFHHVGGATLKAYNHTFSTDNQWIGFGMTWRVSGGGLMQGYVNGTAVESPLTALGIWIGVLDITTTNMGAQDNFGFFCAGKFAHLAVFDYELSAAEMASLALL